MLGRVTAVLCGLEVKEQKAPPWPLPSVLVLLQLTGIPSALAPPGPGVLPQGFAIPQLCFNTSWWWCQCWEPAQGVVWQRGMR